MITHFTLVSAYSPFHWACASLGVPHVCGFQKEAKRNATILAGSPERTNPCKLQTRGRQSGLNLEATEGTEATGQELQKVTQSCDQGAEF